MAELLYRLGKFSARRAWVVIATWLVVLGVAVAGFSVASGPLSSSLDIPGTASGEVADKLAEELPDSAGASGTVIFATVDGSPLTDQQREQITALVDTADGLPDVAGVVDPFVVEKQMVEGKDQLLSGREQMAHGQTAIDYGREAIGAAAKQMDAGQAQIDAGKEHIQAASDQVEAAQDQLNAARDQAVAAGYPISQLDSQQTALDAQRAELDQQKQALNAQQEQLDAGRAQLAEQQDALDAGQEELDTNVEKLEKGSELLSFSDGISTVADDGSTAVVNVAFTEPRMDLADASKEAVMDHFQATPILGVMLGLAVGIDYSLFIINRHRKQLASGMEVQESFGLANGTAGNAVVFAGSTVIVALLALNVVGISFLGVMGTVGAVCVLVAVLLAITMTPALLGPAGERLLGRKPRARLATADASALMSKVKPMPTWRAVLTAVLCVVGLLVLAIPALSMRVGLPDGSSQPEASTSYVAYKTMEDKFGAGVNGPLLVTADLPAGLDEVGLLDAQLQARRQSIWTSLRTC